MIFILRSNVNGSTNDTPYKFTNYFGESFTIEPNSILELKQCLINREPQLLELVTDETVSVVVGNAGNAPITFTIAAGKYSWGGLLNLMNNTFNETIFTNTGYILEFSKQLLNRQLRTTFSCLGYITPTATPGFTVISDDTTPQHYIDTIRTVAEIDKTTGTNTLDDNAFWVSQNINTAVFTDNLYTQGVRYGQVKFNISALSGGIRFAIVRNTFDGTSLDDASMREIACVEISAVRNVFIWENNQNVYNGAVKVGATAFANFTISIPQYKPSVSAGNKQFNYTMVNLDTGVVKQTWHDSSAGAFVTNPNRYRVQRNDEFIFVVQLTSNTDSVDDIQVTLEPNPVIDSSLIEDQLNFTQSSECTILPSSVDNSVQVTADNPLISAAGCYEETFINKASGYQMSFAPNNLTLSYIGISDTAVPDYVAANLTHSIRFDETGSADVYEQGVQMYNITGAYTTGGAERYRITIGSGYSVHYELSTDGGVSWAVAYVSSLYLHDSTDHYTMVLFPDTTNSAGSDVTLYGFLPMVKSSLGGVGQYVKYNLSDNLSEILGFNRQPLEFDLSTTLGNSWPRTAVGADEPDFEADNNSYHIHLDNLPIESYNGFTGKKERSIGIIPKAEEMFTEKDSGQLNVVAFNTQKVSLNNRTQFTANQIQVRITNPDGSQPTGLNTSENTELVLEITPKLR